jgi:hypothetical protein
VISISDFRVFQGASVLFTAEDRRLTYTHKDRTGLVGSVETVLRDLSEKGGLSYMRSNVT